MDPEVPAAIDTECPTCGEETLHDVRKGQLGLRGGLTLDAVATCQECGTTHHVLVRQAPERDVAVIVSQGASSARKVVRLAEDERVELGDELVIGDETVQVTGIEAGDGLRVKRLAAGEIVTIWARHFDAIPVRFSVNLNRKTIAKEVVVGPRETFSIGDELTLGRLRVRIHSIKVQGKLLRSGSAEAKDIVRIFAKPVRL